MGRLVVTEYVSLDGVAQTPGGGEEFVHAGWSFRVERGPEGDAFKLDELRRSDALVFGRITYEGMAAVWPHMSGEFADLFNGLPKFVVSNTITDPGWTNVEVLRGDLADDIAGLKQRFDGDVVVHGSARLVQALLRQDLVDELRLMMFPLLLGTGKRLFAGDGPGDSGEPELKRFRLAASTSVGEGIAVLTYVPAYDFVVGREMPAGVDTVWQAWTQPDDYAAWFGAVPGSVHLDVRPGGTWRLELPAGQGGAPGTMSGSYREVVPRERLVTTTTFGDTETVMEMSFVPTEAGSRVDIRQICDSPTARDGARRGSEILLDACASYLAGSGQGQRSGGA